MLYEPWSGWLNRNTWFFPKITRDPVFRITGLSIFLPLTKHMAPGLKLEKAVYDIWKKKIIYLATIAKILLTLNHSIPVGSIWLHHQSFQIYNVHTKCEVQPIAHPIFREKIFSNRSTNSQSVVKCISTSIKYLRNKIKLHRSLSPITLNLPAVYLLQGNQFVSGLL